MERETERVTLHFDLGPLPANAPFALRTRGRAIPLLGHTDATRQEHARRNRALAALPAQARSRFTHFAADVEMPADAVGFHWVGMPAKAPGALLPAMAATFLWVPQREVRRAARAMRSRGHGRLPALLAHHGAAAASSAQEHDELHAHSCLLINYMKTALMMLCQHPELTSLQGATQHQIMELIANLPSFAEVWQYMSENPADSATPWYTDGVVQAPDGSPLHPVEGLTDKDGQPVTWPQQDGKSVMAHRELSDGVLGAAQQTLCEALKSVKQASWLQGQAWTTAPGVTVKRRNAGAAPRAAASRAPGAATVRNTIKDLSSQYGLVLQEDTLAYDAASKQMSVRVRNWANRGLGAYLQFFDQNDKALGSPSNWVEQLSLVNRLLFAPNSAKKYLQCLGSGNVFFGGPMPVDPITLSFPWPDEAAHARILLGGLGNGDWDPDVDYPGLTYTCVVNYGIPALMTALSIGLQSTQWYTDFFADEGNVVALAAVGTPMFAMAVGAGAVYLDTKKVLIAAGQFAAGIVFSVALKQLAMKATGYVTSAEIMENSPVLGWALRVASCASSIAAMIATSTEVGLSPATYTLDIQRSMDLAVTVEPDPTHGTPSQAPVWPALADHYVVTVQYKGGTAFEKSGPMPGARDAALQVSFADASGDAIPSAAGQQFQVTAAIYSASDWLCGRWVSGWCDAVPSDGFLRSVSGSIVEQLVPLTASTQYSHRQRTCFDGATGQHVWQASTFALDDALEASLRPGPVASGVSAAFWQNGVRLSSAAQVAAAGTGAWTVADPNGDRFAVAKTALLDGNKKVVGYELSVQNASTPAPPQTVKSLSDVGLAELVGITINDQAYKIGYAYRAAGQNLPLDNGTTPQSSAMYVFATASTLARPEQGSKRPSRGFSIKADIAFDQFGPAGLFTLAPASGYGSDLDGGVLSGEVSNAFSAKGYPLPAGAAVSVVTPGAAWRIGPPGAPLYDLRRDVDAIKVFNYPAPEFSPNNFYLDTRSFPTRGVSHLRGIDLHDSSGPDFDYASGKSFGTFSIASLDRVVVHPNGYAIAISYENDKMEILRLPAAAVPDAAAPSALPFSGTGVREGLMQGPVALTVTADGRILVLERDNGRIQAFDTYANPVQCFASGFAFTTGGELASDLAGGAASTPLLQALQKAIPQASPASAAARLLAVPLFSVDGGLAPGLDQGSVGAALAQAFASAGRPLSSEATLAVTTPGQLWWLSDATNGAAYDLRWDADMQEVQVLRGFSLAVTEVTPLSRWTVRDTANTLTFDVSVKHGLLWKQLVSTMGLRDGVSNTVVYLDVAAETKGYVYVLAYDAPGSSRTAYHVDVYNPDGSFLVRTSSVNGARLAVDQWRSLFTLNYEAISGPQGRLEPSVSQWIPSAPAAFTAGGRGRPLAVAAAAATGDYALAASELAPLQGLLSFQGSWGPGPRQLQPGDWPAYFGAMSTLASGSSGGVVNAKLKAWLDGFFGAVVATPTSLGQDLAALYAANAYAQFTRLGLGGWGNWKSWWDAFQNGYAWPDGPGHAGGQWGPWGAPPPSYMRDTTPWRPTRPAAWQQANAAVLSQWGASPPPSLIAVGTDIKSGYTTSDFVRSALGGWSDFANVATTSYVLWQAQTDALNALLQPDTLDDASYFFLLHLLAGVATGNPAAQRLAARVASAPTSSPEYPNDTFVNQLVYAALLHLADPLGGFAWDNAALQAFVSSLRAAVLPADPASAALRQSLASHGQVLHVDGAYPMQDPYAPSVGFTQRRTDTLFALDQARAALRG